MPVWKVKAAICWYMYSEAQPLIFTFSEERIARFSTAEGRQEGILGADYMLSVFPLFILPDTWGGHKRCQRRLSHLTSTCDKVENITGRRESWEETACCLGYRTRCYYISLSQSLSKQLRSLTLVQMLNMKYLWEKKSEKRWVFWLQDAECANGYHFTIAFNIIFFYKSNFKNIIV